MVVCALLIGLSSRWLWIISLSIIFGHNLLDNLSFSQWPILQNLWLIIHERGWLEFSGIRLRTSYPVLPWIAIMTLGYCLGRSLFAQPSGRLAQYLVCLGASLLGLFVLLRSINVYGDQPWQVMPNLTQTVMSFLNLTKYPPSLLFILCTLGIGFIVLAILHRYQQQRWLKPLVVLGSVPMFFYVVHIYALKLVYLLAHAIWGENQRQYFGVTHISSIWWISMCLAIILYPLMLKFSRFKHQNSHKISLLKYF